jgi:glutamine amidotransferase
MTPGIVIVDYGMGNLRSVQKAFERLGHHAVISSEPATVGEATKLVVPGVGAFRDGIARLRETGLGDLIVDHVRAGWPFLGICLGMQFLSTRSHEDGIHEGMNIFPGEVVRFTYQPGLKIPHMGWNQLRFHGSCPLFRGLEEGAAVYFVHSYHVVPEDRSIVAAEADYPGPFVAALWRDHIFATQFHPEKSQSVGLTMLKNFAEF